MPLVVSSAQKLCRRTSLMKTTGDEKNEEFQGGRGARGTLYLKFICHDTFQVRETQCTGEFRSSQKEYQTLFPFPALFFTIFIQEKVMAII